MFLSLVGIAALVIGASWVVFGVVSYIAAPRFTYPKPLKKAAQERAMRLLEANLNERQLAEWKESERFTVIGSDGVRYAIDNKEPFGNVRSLSDDGAYYCFEPNGHLPAGDKLLAQKIWLENDAPHALGIANSWRFNEGVIFSPFDIDPDTPLTVIDIDDPRMAETRSSTITPTTGVVIYDFVP